VRQDIPKLGISPVRWRLLSLQAIKQGPAD